MTPAVPTTQNSRARLTAQRSPAPPSVLVVGGDGGPNVARALQDDGYAVTATRDAGPSLDLVLEASRHDLIVLGATSANDGLGLLKVLREWRVQAPVIVVFDHDRVDDKVAGLDAGADDVMAKPVAGEELRARARALLRRPAPRRESPLRLADLVLDPVTREVRRAEQRICLTPREFALLEYLLRNAGRVLSRCMILEKVWGLGFDPESNLVDVYIGYLRRKIERNGSARLLHSVRGVGYSLAAEPP
jgi:DNA-binding response OmpR family regulator